ncbi:hypothetical protein ACUNIY_00370 [Serratia sp. IR-2025]|uniref:hypothetical protein n=1 Tax=Serratia marcescens TaxID=615 RepID=UPI003879AE48
MAILKQVEAGTAVAELLHKAIPVSSGTKCLHDRPPERAGRHRTQSEAEMSVYSFACPLFVISESGYHYQPELNKENKAVDG